MDIGLEDLKFSNNLNDEKDLEILNGEIPHKKMFLKQYKVEMNWRYKPVRTPKHLKGHDDHVITCLQFDGNKIVSGSDDNTLKVWSAVTGNIIRTLVGHTGNNHILLALTNLLVIQLLWYIYIKFFYTIMSALYGLKGIYINVHFLFSR